MYKIYIVIAFFSVHFLAAQENNKPTVREHKSTESQKDSLLFQMAKDDRLLLNNAVENDRPHRNSENIRENLVRRKTPVRKNLSETEIKKQTDTLN